jgi:hypothetical protein
MERGNAKQHLLKVTCQEETSDESKTDACAAHGQTLPENELQDWCRPAPSARRIPISLAIKINRPPASDDYRNEEGRLRGGWHPRVRLPTTIYE